MPSAVRKVIFAKKCMGNNCINVIFAYNNCKIWLLIFINSTNHGIITHKFWVSFTVKK